MQPGLLISIEAQPGGVASGLQGKKVTVLLHGFPEKGGSHSGLFGSRARPTRRRGAGKFFAPNGPKISQFPNYQRLPHFLRIFAGDVCYTGGYRRTAELANSKSPLHPTTAMRNADWEDVTGADHRACLKRPDTPDRAGCLSRRRLRSFLRRWRCGIAIFLLLWAGGSPALADMYITGNVTPDLQRY